VLCHIKVNQKSEPVLSNQKRLLNRQESLRVYHKRLMKAIALMKLVEADGATALEDIVHGPPAPPYMQDEADECMRSPYARDCKKDLSMKSIPSIIISEPTESQVEGMVLQFLTFDSLVIDAASVFHVNSINATWAELTGSTPNDVTSINSKLKNPPTPPRISLDVVAQPPIAPTSFPPTQVKPVATGWMSPALHSSTAFDQTPGTATAILELFSAALQRDNRLFTAHIPSSLSRAWTVPILAKAHVCISTKGTLTRPHARSDPPHLTLKRSTIPPLVDRELFGRVYLNQKRLQRAEPR
jgi:hypothetical protein